MFSFFLFIALVILLSCFYFDQGVLFSSNTLSRVDTSSKTIALTFDDGPHPEWTPKVLEILKENKILASFFLVGDCVAKYPEIVRAIAADGHCIGNHSYGHEPIWMYSKDNFLKNIIRTQHAIESACGITPKFIRPPKGFMRQEQKSILKEHKLTSVLWTLNTKDWCSKSVSKLKNRIKKKLSPGDILLFHDGGGVFFNIKGSRKTTVNCLKEIIPEMKSENWNFVTIDKAAA